MSGPGQPRTPRKSVLVGPGGKVAASYEKVTPADHPAQVLADIDRLA